MFKAISSPFLIDGSEKFSISSASTAPKQSSLKENNYKKKLDKLTIELDNLQRVLFASQKYAVLLIFQAMDAAGKDGTIRAVMSGVNPAGCDVKSFQKPTALEYKHDFLWRTATQLPEKGKIVIFNRSYYEEVLITRVHPEYLEQQNIPWQVDQDTLWNERFESILDHEKHMVRNGTIVLKFFLNISMGEQKKRFLSRIDDLDKNWKFAKSDVEERKCWDEYMHAYQEAINITAKPWAPWYSIPADDKSFMRYCVADIIVNSLKSLGLTYPRVSSHEQKQIQEMRDLLE